MISAQEKALIYQNAIIPEQLPHYVEAVTQAETFLFEECPVYVRGGHITLVAYPLGRSSDLFEGDNSWLVELLAELQRKFDPQVFAVISPMQNALFSSWDLKGEDQYYRLDLDSVRPDKKLRNIIHRAQTELSVSFQEKFDCRHKRLVNEFLRTHKVSPETHSIFKRLPRIIRHPECVLISAVNLHRQLVAFDVFDFSAAETGFYLFNFFSRSHYVPGASDLLLWHGIDYARQHGKKRLNLGLGIHPGIERFKQKWGSQPYLKYFAFQKEPDVEEAVDALYAKI